MSELSPELRAYLSAEAGDDHIGRLDSLWHRLSDADRAYLDQRPAPPIDLSAVPIADLRAEIERRRAAKPGPVPKLVTCPKCGKSIPTRYSRISCERNHTPKGSW